MSTRLQVRKLLGELAADTRAPPVAFTCLAFLSVVIGAHLSSIPWIGLTLVLHFLALLLWGRPTLRLQPASLPAAEQARLRCALAACMEGASVALKVECVGVEGAPFSEPATVVTESNTSGTIFVRRDQLAALSEPQLQALLARELVHLSRRNDVHRWTATAVTMFLLVAGSSTLALLRLCLGWRVGAVDLLASVVACFVGIPTAVFLAQHVLHELEYDADRELLRRKPVLAPALIEWLEQEEARRPPPFVVLPHPVPFAAERVAHLHRHAKSRAGGALARRLSALGAVGLLIAIGFALAELIDGRVPDVKLKALPTSGAREALTAAESVQSEIAHFSWPSVPPQAATEIRQTAEQVEALKRRFERPEGALRVSRP